MNSFNSTELLDEALNCLTDKLGLEATDRFMASLAGGSFDYSAWRRAHGGGKASAEAPQAAGGGERAEGGDNEPAGTKGGERLPPPMYLLRIGRRVKGPIRGVRI